MENKILPSGLITGKRYIITDVPEIEPKMQDYTTNTTYRTYLTNPDWQKSRLNNWNSFSYYSHKDNDDKFENIWEDDNYDEINGINIYNSDSEDTDKIIDSFINVSPTIKKRPLTDLEIDTKKSVEITEFIKFIMYGTNYITKIHNANINTELKKIKDDRITGNMLYLDYEHNIENFIILLQQEFVYNSNDGANLRALCIQKVIELLDADINLFVDNAHLFINMNHGFKVWYILYLNYRQIITSDLVILYEHCLEQIIKIKNELIIKELQYLINHIENELLVQNLKHAKEWADYLSLEYAVDSINDLLERERCLKTLDKF